MTPKNDSASALIIVGMHRSGTSLTASLLQEAGVHIGARLLGPHKSNIKGHFENLDFLDFHRSVLMSQAIHPDGWTLQNHIPVESGFADQAQSIIEQNRHAPIWGWKDPRTSLFLDFWEYYLPKANYLVVYRAPWEVVDSLYRRGTDTIFNRQPDLAPKIWCHYNQTILNFISSIDNIGRIVIVNIETVINNSKIFLEYINRTFKVELNIISSISFEPDIFHKSQGRKFYSIIDRYFPEAISLYDDLEMKAWYPIKKTETNNSIDKNIISERKIVFDMWRSLRVQEDVNQKLERELLNTRF